jgi:hypothetical protein
VSSFQFKVDEWEFDYRFGCAGRKQAQDSPSAA